MKAPLPLLGMAGSALPGLLASGGLYALAPLQFTESQPQYFLCVTLLVILWLSCVTVFISLLCLIASVVFKLHNGKEPSTGLDPLGDTEDDRLLHALLVAESK